MINTIGENKKYIAYLALLFLVFTPGFATAWFRLFVPERSELFFFAIFLYAFLQYQKNQKTVFFIAGLLAANIALYYKEPAFLMLGTFAFFHLVFGWREINFKQKLYDFLLMLSSLVFITVYFFVVYIHKGNNLYGDTTLNPLLVISKNIFNYSLNDPLLIFSLIPFAIWRVVVIIKTKNANAVYDPMLFGALIYLLVFVKLNMFAPHYLLPVYLFAIPALLYFFVIEKLYKNIKFKILASITLFMIAFSSFPVGLHYISHYKNVPSNFQNTLTFLKTYIQNEANKNNRTNIFIDGINRGSNCEVYHSFIKNLEFLGLKSSQFDIKSDEVDDGILGKPVEDKNSSYSVISSSQPSEVKSGDLLILTPYTKHNLCGENIENYFKDYELIYSSGSTFPVPNFSIKAALKYFFASKVRGSGADEKMMISDNFFDMPLEFYVLKKK
jgi:hypothetical protein